MRGGIVICSRLASSRIPKKAFVRLNGVPLLEHLLNRISYDETDLISYLAVPACDFDAYREFVLSRNLDAFVKVISGPEHDPLKRLLIVAERFDLEFIVRICHDKIFVDPKQIISAIEVFKESKVDYLYSSTFVDGSGFEIISTDAIKKASSLHKNVEHVGYAIKTVTNRCLNLTCSNHSKHRLLIDYPKDLGVIELILSSLGNDCTLGEALFYLDENPFISKMNQLPLVTVYTCAYQADKWLEEAFGSVCSQDHFGEMEYLLIDDFSQDKTPHLMASLTSKYANTTWRRNSSNLGLASSSNRALSEAKGKYIIRLDADDYFTTTNAVMSLIAVMEASEADIVYPNNYYGSFKRIQRGDEQHHVGGALFRTRAANHIKFTEGLRGYEGYDFFERAKDQLKIAYHQKPLFFYRQHKASLSASNHEERNKLKERIDGHLTSRNRTLVS